MSRNAVWSIAAAMAVCSGASAPAFAQSLPFTVTQVADFDIPWAMAFLPDGSLVIGTGDGFNYREQAQKLGNHLGKIVRIHSDGTVPASVQ